MEYVTFLPMLYIWTDVSILSYLKMLLYTKDFIPDIYEKQLNNLKLHKYYISICTNCMSIFEANANISSQHNIHTKANIYNIGGNVRSVTFVETVKTSI